jgi:hypothetical protein
MDFTSLLALWQNPATRNIAITAVVCWLVSAALHAMPSPLASSGLAYRWLFSTVQSLGANFAKLKEAGKPFANVQTVEAATLLAAKPAELIQAIADAKPVVTEKTNGK